MNGQINNLGYLKETRKHLRNNLTSAEAALWRCLSGSKLEGRKFKRLHSVGNYILDFYCPSEKLAVELDGSVHFTSIGYQNDLERTNHLEYMGIRVIRFENYLVFKCLDDVLKEIKGCFKSTHSFS